MGREAHHQKRRPRNGATPTGDVTASRALDKAVARQRSAAVEASARPALIRQEERRERQRVSQTTRTLIGVSAVRVRP